MIYTFMLAWSVDVLFLQWYTLRTELPSGGISGTEEISCTTQIQAEAVIIRIECLCEGEDVTSNSKV